MSSLVIGSLASALAACFLIVLVRHGMRWGARRDEIDAEMTGDAWLGGRGWAFVRMTRAIDIDVPAAMVWPWLAQLGRGAGWYSWDFLDNGGRSSARHLVSWIPAPSLGDATAIGYLRHLEPRREVVWWLDESPFLGATVRSTMAYRVVPRLGGDCARLALRIQADARGWGALLVMLLFPLIDSIMACRQLVNLKRKAEWYGNRAEDPARLETGARDQFQSYQVIYASGEEAGIPGREGASSQRARAVADGVLQQGPGTG